MTVKFDTLTYSKRLRAAGVPREQADAHAEAALYLFRAIASRDGMSRAPDAMSDLPAVTADLVEAIERANRRITVWVGGMIVAAFTVYGLIIVGFFGKITPPI